MSANSYIRLRHPLDGLRSQGYRGWKQIVIYGERMNNMTGTIKVNTAKLRSTASALQAKGNQVKNTTNRMMTLVNGLTGNVWSGDAARTYLQKFKSLQDDMNKMYRMISEHVKDLNEMAAAYEKAESENQSAANSLSGNVIR